MREVVRVDPGHVQHRRMLIGFLGEGQLMNEIPEHLQALIKVRKFDAALLETIALPGRRFSVDPLAELHKRNPEDLRLNIAQVVSLMDAAKYSEAIPLLRAMVERHKEFDPGWSLLARSLAMVNDYDQLDHVIAAMPETFQVSADWEFSVGRLHRHHGRTEQAIAATWRSIERQPNVANSLTELTSLLVQWHDQENAPPLQSQLNRTMNALVRRRASLANLLHHVGNFAHSGHVEREKAIMISSTLFDLGRLWEAEAWSAVAMTLKPSADPELLRDAALRRTRDPDPNQLAILRRQILGSMAASSPWQAPVEQLIPIPKPLQQPWKPSPSTLSIDAPRAQDFRSEEVRFRFRDQADLFGIHYTGHTGPKRFWPHGSASRFAWLWPRIARF